MKTYLISIVSIFAFSLLVTSCGPATTEEDHKQAEESAKELEAIDYDNVEMPDSGEETEDASEEEFDADAMLD
ncbi:MAG: hypothetical protein N4A35_10805 [Flavobacteriales bacterium]|jgi:hypothetical protein|nr:hypothetical protein [Flavobacteriales bacterium]